MIQIKQTNYSKATQFEMYEKYRKKVVYLIHLFVDNLTIKTSLSEIKITQKLCGSK